MEQKISLLTLGLSQIPDVVALQLTVEGSDLPILVTDQDFSRHLAEAGLDPVETLRSADRRHRRASAATAATASCCPAGSRRPATGSPPWRCRCAPQLAGRSVTFSAQIDLAPLGALVRDNPFTRRGEIAVVDAERPHRARARAAVARRPGDRRQRRAARRHAAPARRRSRATSRPDGEAMLGAYAFPDAFPWAIITELSEENAYAVVNHMLRNLLLVGLAGFGVAAAAALFFAGRLTGPILKIGAVAARVGAGDLARPGRGRAHPRRARRSRAARMNTMIRELSERLELMKFVSRGTVTAIRAADAAGVARGGERRSVAVLFSDIRGYTAFSEAVAPEVVVEMLNQYLDAQTVIVERHGGDVDKFIGDEVVAVFQGADMERNAVACGLEIQRALADLLEAHPEWNLHVGVGIAAGEVVMGAIGARERLDFTVLGGVVNLARAALRRRAARRDPRLRRGARRARRRSASSRSAPLPPIELKGLSAPVTVFAAYAAEAADEVA